MAISRKQWIRTLRGEAYLVPQVGKTYWRANRPSGSKYLCTYVGRDFCVFEYEGEKVRYEISEEFVETVYRPRRLKVSRWISARNV